MKLVKCNGKLLEVRDCGPIIFRLAALPGGPPIKVNGYHIMEEDAARDLLRDLLSLGEYEGGKVTEEATDAD